MEQLEKKIKFLANLFQHLDGIALIPTVIKLQHKQVLEYIQSKNKCSLTELSSKFNANECYMNVALRLLCSQGVLKQKIINEDVYFTDVNIEQWFSLDLLTHYQMLNPLFNNDIDYNEIIEYSKENNNNKSVLYQVIYKYLEWRKEDKTTDSTTQKNCTGKWSNWRIHLEGAVLGPILVLLSRNNCFSQIQSNKTLIIKINQDWKTLIENLFLACEILDSNMKLTDYGSFILTRASSYGVTVSYLPTYRNIHNLIYGDFNILKAASVDAEELHVDRSMNVWGSGGAHNTYFKKIDKIILDLFNLPIEQQPKGFIDIGCGNGKLIEHIFDLIYYNTNRGKILNEHPLFIVGSDFNYKALEATTKTINQADIWAKTAFGDISDPDGLAHKLKQEHNINLVDLLNVRSFLDHNRIYTTPKERNQEFNESTGAFCSNGLRLQNRNVQQNLKEHLKRWYPYLTKYGLLIVELHTIDPFLSSKNIGKTAITAYDASHGFSNQYILEYDIFLKIAHKIGLQPDPEHEYTFPTREIPIVSINRLIAN
ncbi:MAG: polyketide synthase [Flavobacteriales bacterium]|nr:polyketide synthase [Flavobacteriales bacterium]|tara:strand:+ start:902 stop:2518 length:1617 start_codon:yes stop_codon:yes gene_type:complete